MQTIDAQTQTINRSSRLKRLITLYETGQASDFMDRVIDKVFAQEAAEAKEAIERIEGDLSAYEEQYGMKSDEFYRRFRSGELGDKMDFVEWGSLMMMKEDLLKRLQILTGER
jgi:hypothetical protein